MDADRKMTVIECHEQTASVFIRSGEVSRYRVEFNEGHLWWFKRHQRRGYRVGVHRGKGVNCTCPAGQYGKPCKHREAAGPLLQYRHQILGGKPCK